MVSNLRLSNKLKRPSPSIRFGAFVRVVKDLGYSMDIILFCMSLWIKCSIYWLCFFGTNCFKRSCVFLVKRNVLFVLRSCGISFFGILYPLSGFVYVGNVKRHMIYYFTQPRWFKVKVFSGCYKWTTDQTVNIKFHCYILFEFCITS